MVRHFAVLAASLLVAALVAEPAYAEERCEIRSSWTGSPDPTHKVAFIFVGVQDQRVVLSVDETPVFEARLSTEDHSTSFSGETQCLMAGRYRISVKIGEAEGDLAFDISEETTVYLNAYRGVMSFNIWGPDAPGLD